MQVGDYCTFQHKVANIADTGGENQQLITRISDSETEMKEQDFEL